MIKKRAKRMNKEGIKRILDKKQTRKEANFRR